MGELESYQTRADLLGLICPFEEAETKEPLNDDFGIYTVAYPLFQMGTNVPLKKTVAAELYGDFVRNFHVPRKKKTRKPLFSRLPGCMPGRIRTCDLQSRRQFVINPAGIDK